MKQKLPLRRMRRHPNLEQLKRQAKELLAAFRASDQQRRSVIALRHWIGRIA